ncbi:unnamed protein product [Pleuronectes platessa]|uniref:Uncharacterized protein n=1 Tax=Pleuronectes platessa TaxID=8262 RepID=A0A9N7YIB7_PLEPL|nr:unnamed protein product [Pleuronectes platessa]
MTEVPVTKGVAVSGTKPAKVRCLRPCRRAGSEKMSAHESSRGAVRKARRAFHGVAHAAPQPGQDTTPPHNEAPDGPYPPAPPSQLDQTRDPPLHTEHWRMQAGASVSRTSATTSRAKGGDRLPKHSTSIPPKKQQITGLMTPDQFAQNLRSDEDVERLVPYRANRRDDAVNMELHCILQHLRPPRTDARAGCDSARIKTPSPQARLQGQDTA